MRTPTEVTAANYFDTGSTVYSNCYTTENDGMSEYEPLKQGWKILISFIPFVCVFQVIKMYPLFQAGCPYHTRTLSFL